MTPDGQVAPTNPAPAVDPAPTPTAAPTNEPVQDTEFDLDAAWKETVLDESGNTVQTDPAPANDPAPAEGEPPASEPAKATPAEEITPAPTPAPDPAPAEAQPAPAAPIAADPPSPPTPEEERQALLEEERELATRTRAFQTRTGQPLHNPAEVQREIEGYDAYKALEEDMPDVLKGLEFAISQRVKEFSGDLSAQVADGNITAADAAQHEAVLVQHSDYPLLLKNPAPFVEWLDTIPGKDYREAQAIIEAGGAGDVSKLVTKFKAAKGITDYSELLGDPAPAPAAGAPAPENPAPGVTQAPAATPPGAPPDPKATELAENAAAVPGEGTGDPGITNSEVPTDEQAARKEWDAISDSDL